MEHSRSTISIPVGKLAHRVAPTLMALQLFATGTHEATSIKKESRQICTAKETPHKAPWNHPELEATLANTRWKLQRIRERNESIDLDILSSNEIGWSLAPELSMDQASAVERFLSSKDESRTCKPYRMETLRSHPENYKEKLELWMLPDYNAFILFFDEEKMSELGIEHPPKQSMVRPPKQNPERLIIVKYTAKKGDIDLEAMLLDSDDKDRKPFKVEKSSALHGLAMDMQKNSIFMERNENAQSDALDKKQAEKLAHDRNFINRIQDALVEIMPDSKHKSEGMEYGGTGYIYDDRTLVTARHVANVILEDFFKVKAFDPTLDPTEDEKVKQRVMIKNMSAQEYSVVADKTEDVAIIRFRNPVFDPKKALPMSQSPLVDDYYFMRHMMGYGRKRHWVIEAQRGRFGRENIFPYAAGKTEKGFLITQIQTQGGNSGTPILTQRGEVTALIVGNSGGGADEFTYAIPMTRDKIFRLIREADGDLERKSLGMEREKDCRHLAQSTSVGKK